MKNWGIPAQPTVGETEVISKTRAEQGKCETTASGGRQGAREMYLGLGSSGDKWLLPGTGGLQESNSGVWRGGGQRHLQERKQRKGPVCGTVCVVSVSHLAA